MFYWSKRNYYYRTKNDQMLLWVGNSKSLLEVDEEFSAEVDDLVTTGKSNIV